MWPFLLTLMGIILFCMCVLDCDSVRGWQRTLTTWVAAGALAMLMGALAAAGI